MGGAALAHGYVLSALRAGDVTEGRAWKRLVHGIAVQGWNVIGGHFPWAALRWPTAMICQPCGLKRLRPVGPETDLSPDIVERATLNWSVVMGAAVEEQVQGNRREVNGFVAR